MSNLTFTFTGTIEDNHGVLHINPVFAIQRYNKHTDNNTAGYLQNNEGVLEYQEEASENKNFDYSVQFWTNQTAKDEDKDPIYFQANNNSHFYFQPETNPSTHANIRSACQDHFLSEILPQCVVTE